MFLSEQLTDAISIAIKSYSGVDGKVRLLRSIAGGSINKCFQIEYGKEFFFLKVNSLVKLPAMFIAEAEGLKRMRQTKTVLVPEVICHGSAADEQFLVLEWIESGVVTETSQEALGRQLAQLHKCTQPSFGLDHNNYMGSLAQVNKQRFSWTEYFIEERLKPQVELGKQRGLLAREVVDQFEKLYIKLDSLYPAESPALIHGDLWSGNYLVNNSKQPVLVDPAISYSNREADIAMATLFGGFHQCFYNAYDTVFPLQQGWKERLDLWNLYPLLIHVNLFGTSYLSGIKHTLATFISSRLL
jgi:protein-ribulosamine 3-kinase